MEQEDLEKENPFQKQSCYDCDYLLAYVTHWCSNKKAIEYRGTRTPGVVHCHFWKPYWKSIPKKYRTAEFGYVHVPLLQRIKALFTFNQR